MTSKEVCPYCGNVDIYLYDTTFDETKNETIGHYNCFKCFRGFDLSLGKGVTVLIDEEGVENEGI